MYRTDHTTDHLQDNGPHTSLMDIGTGLNPNGLTSITTGLELDPALSLDLERPPSLNGSELAAALPHGLPNGDGELHTDYFPNNNLNSGTDPDLGPPTKAGGSGTGMGQGNGMGLGCHADNSNFLYLGSLEVQA